MIGAVARSLVPVPGSVSELVPEFVAAFAPDWSSVSAGVLSPPEGAGPLSESLELGSDFGSGSEPAFTGSEFEFEFELASTGCESESEFEPAFTALLLPVACEP